MSLNEVFTLFHTATDVPLILYDNELNQIRKRYPTISPTPPQYFLNIFRKQFTPQTTIYIFLVQQANIFAFIRTAVGYTMLWSQPLPIYTTATNQLEFNSGVKFLPKLIALTKQLYYDITQEWPNDSKIQVTTLNIEPEKNQLLTRVWQQHNSNNAEAQMLDALATGDTIHFTQQFDQFLASGEPGLLNPASSLRNQKNLAIVATTLFTRAALRAGVLSEEAYALSDQYIQNIEKMTKIDDLRNYILNIGLNFIQKVQLVEHPKALPLVTKAQDYISKNLGQPLSVAKIATAIGVSSSYLMKLFKSQIHMSVGTYMTIKKIRTAQTLLIYTSNSIAAIAEQLGYSSQSYFSRQFSQIVKKSPSQYRKEKQNQLI